jgi:alpha-ketoglutarate-dependent taurine dioxygenase
MIQSVETSTPGLSMFKGSAAQSHLVDGVLKVYPELPGRFPIVYWPAHEGVMLLPWLEKYRGEVEAEVLRYGASIFKGFFDISDIAPFQEAFSIICGKPLAYQFRTSPRTEVANNMYTSTDHPADQIIHMHTESSYSPSWPRHLAFYCHTPSVHGGETPIASERKVIEHLPESVIDKFDELKIRYVRNFSKGLGLPWQKVFQTESTSDVEEYLKKENIQYEWRTEETLHMEWVLPAFRKHPVTGEKLWFNHMHFGHKSLYDRKVLKVVPESHLPFLTYYGDGSVIEDEVINTMLEAYDQHKIESKWQKNDFMVLENMIFSHGRKAYEGNRKIIVAMGNEVDGSEA